MAQKIDSRAVKRSRLLSEVLCEIVPLKADGANEFRGLCPFHDEKTPSFTVKDCGDDSFYHCFGCGAHGDAIDFVMETQSVDFKTACEVIAGNVALLQTGGDTPKRDSVRPEVDDPYFDVVPVIPVPPGVPMPSVGKRINGVFNPKRRDDPEKKFTGYSPSAVYDYRDKDGNLVGLVIRQEIGERDKDGKRKKLTPQLLWCHLPNGEQGWSHQRMPEPRTLYNLPAVYARPEAPILWVEGEKCVDAAPILKSYVAVTNVGGTGGARKADFRPVKGRDVLIWPDNDAVGQSAVSEKVIPLMIEAGAKSIRVIGSDPEKPKGWDIADAVKDGMTARQIAAWAKPRAHDVEIAAKQQEENVETAVEEKAEEVFESAPLVNIEDSPPMPDEVPPEYDSEGESHSFEKRITEEDDALAGDRPFRILGHNKGKRYYLPRSTRQVVELSPSQHNHNNLLSLANLKFWQENFYFRTR